MTIKTSDIISITIRDAIKELQIKYNMDYDKTEAIATHIIMNDEDYTNEYI